MNLIDAIAASNTHTAAAFVNGYRVYATAEGAAHDEHDTVVVCVFDGADRVQLGPDWVAVPIHAAKAILRVPEKGWIAHNS